MTLTGDEFHRHGDSLRHPAGGRGTILPAHDREIIAPQCLPAECRRHKAWDVEAHWTLFHAEHRRRRRTVKRKRGATRCAQYTPPTSTRLNCRVESRRRCVLNSQLVEN